MDKTLEDIQVLHVNGVPYAVDAMSDQVRKLVAVLSRWRREEFEHQDKVAMLKAAQETLHRQIAFTIQKEKEAAAVKDVREDGEVAEQQDVATANEEISNE